MKRNRLRDVINVLKFAGGFFIGVLHLATRIFLVRRVSFEFV